MKFAITPEDKLALVISIVPHECRGAERQDARITTWDDLEVREFARLSSQRIARFGERATFTVDEVKQFSGTKRVLVDLQPSSVQFLIDEITAGVPGVYQDQLTELRYELRQLQEKTYKLPEELREKPKK